MVRVIGVGWVGLQAIQKNVNMMSVSWAGNKIVKVVLKKVRGNFIRLRTRWLSRADKSAV